MLPTGILTKPCTITSRTDSGTVDDYGNPVPAEASATTVCDLQQQSRTEPNDQGELSDTMWALFLPPGTEIATSDVVTVDGVDYEVVGDPWHARMPRTGIASHVEATLRRTA